ncbi:MAG: hypothetical protein R3E01_25145 [Pirellulaceae bacterium]
MLIALVSGSVKEVQLSTEASARGADQGVHADRPSFGPAKLAVQTCGHQLRRFFAVEG